jgi:hypothetical protein
VLSVQLAPNLATSHTRNWTFALSLLSAFSLLAQRPAGKFRDILEMANSQQKSKNVSTSTSERNLNDGWRMIHGSNN